MADREEPRVPKWIGPFIAGSALTAMTFSYRSSKDAKAIQGSNTESTASFELKTGVPFRTARSADEAVVAIADGTLRKQVFEYGSATGDGFTYVFSTSGTNQQQVLLRGVQSGPEREEVLRKFDIQGVKLYSVVVPEGGGAPVDQAKLQPPWYQSLYLPAAIVLGVWILSRYLKRGLESAMDGELGGGKAGLQKFVERPKDRFSDVGGNKTVVAELRAVKNEITAYQKGEDTARLPRGMLMYGEPGTGKTFMARVLCGECECPMFYMNAGDLTQSSYMGAWTRSVKKMFKEARDLRDKGTKELRAKPGATGKEEQAVVIFLDEFDSIGKARNDEEINGEHGRAVNTLLSEMDGIEQSKNRGIIIIAATNNPDSLDPALKRPGRFSLQMKVPLPETVEERLDILEKVSKKALDSRKMTLEDPRVLADLAKATGDISPDHLRGIVERGIELAHREGKTVVGATDVFEAYQQTLFGHARDQVLNETRAEFVACHEHGHGILGLACGRAPLVISMRPRGASLGRVVIDSHPLMEPAATRADLLKALVIAAGGRAAEVFSYGAEGTSAGVGSDFDQMERIGRKILDSGMIDGGYGIPSANTPSWELPADYRATLQRLCGNAVACAVKVLEVVGKERLAKISTESLAIRRELVGLEARSFYPHYLNDETTAKLRAVVDAFVREPFEKKKFGKAPLPPFDTTGGAHASTVH